MKLVKKSFILSAFTLAALTGLSGCASTTNTGALAGDRQQLLLVSSEQVLRSSAQTYNRMLQAAKAKGVLDTNTRQLNRLNRIANRIIPEVGVYRPDAKRWNWEIHTIKSDTVNAFVLPGGKIMFFTGILDKNKLGLTDAEVAAIMAHEMAHALREHSRERMSSAIATQATIGIAASALGLSQGQAQLANIAGDIGVSRPHSRVQESEADVIGLELMARAGYNPQAAITLWQKMQRYDSRQVPQFLSTHPNDANRIATLQSYMPRVMRLYNTPSAGAPSEFKPFTP